MLFRPGNWPRWYSIKVVAKSQAVALALTFTPLGRSLAVALALKLTPLGAIPRGRPRWGSRGEAITASPDSPSTCGCGLGDAACAGPWPRSGEYVHG